MQIWSMGQKSIHVIDAESEYSLRPLADRLAKESKYDCYFRPQYPKAPHTFIALDGNAPAGFLQMDRLFHDLIADVETPEGLFAKKVDPAQQIWGVVCIWVTPSHRKRGFGKQLCLSGATYFSATPEMLAWSTPVSSDGRCLLKSLGVRTVKLG